MNRRDPLNALAAWALLPMARRAGLRSRLGPILDAATNRRPVPAWAICVASATAIAMVPLLAAVRFTRAEPPPVATQPAVDPVALVREVRRGQQWVTAVNSFRVRLEDHESQLKDGEPQPDTLRHSTTEFGFDRHRVYVRRDIAADPQTPGDSNWVDRGTWDGSRGTSSTEYDRPTGLGTVDGKPVRSTQRYGLFIPKPDQTFEAFFVGSLPWPNLARYGFWWVPSDEFEGDEYFGRPEDFRLSGRVTFRGVNCYQLDCDDYFWTLYVGVVDHRLYGAIQRATPRGEAAKTNAILLQIAAKHGAKLIGMNQYFAWRTGLSAERGQAVDHEFMRTELPLARPWITQWYTDYKQVGGPEQWIPMRQGYDLWDTDDPSPKGRTPTSRRDSRVVDVAIDQPLPEAMFAIELRPGALVDDDAHDPPLTYVSKATFSPREWQAILDAGTKRAAKAKAQAEQLRSGAGRTPVDFPDGWVQGKPTKLADLAGKVAIVEFWAGWSAQSRDDVARLNELADAGGRNGIAVVSVHAAGTPAEDVRREIAARQIRYPVCLDAPAQPSADDGRLFLDARITRLPTTVVIDRLGHVAFAGTLADALNVADRLVGHGPATEPNN